MLTARQLDWLLEDLCSQAGFCLPPAAREHLRERPPADVASFVDAVFRAEGLDPLQDRRLRDRVHILIAAAFERAAN